MKISESEVRYVADLANLKLAESEIARLAKDMDEILTHMDALNEIDTSDVEPMAQVLYRSGGNGHLRADQPNVHASERGSAGQCAAGGHGLLQSSEGHRKMKNDR